MDINNMTNTDKILAEFESFDSFFAGLSMQDEKKAMKLYEKYIQSLLVSKITQALAEERERVRGIVKRTIGINTTTTFDEVVYKNGIDVKEYINKYDLISSLDRPDK